MKRYIAIDLIALKQHNLTLEDWTLLENIYFMSNNDFGYCYASKNTLREIIQVSNGQIYKIIKKLIDNGFLIKNEETGYLKVTQKWIQISSGEGIQKMENTSPKNGNTPIQKMDTKIDTIKGDNKEEEKQVKEVDIVNFYKQNISKENQKVKEVKAVNTLALIQDDFQSVLTGLKNYSKNLPSNQQYIKSLPNFIQDKVYLDYQEPIKHKQQNTNLSKSQQTNDYIDNYFERMAEQGNNEVIDCEVIS